MRKPRMTEEEYLNTKACIERLRIDIHQLRKEKNQLVKKMQWYEFSKGKLKNTYESGLSYKYFGKRYKDLTKDEKKEYNKITTRLSRERKRNAKI